MSEATRDHTVQSSNRRGHYRIDYPVRDRPRFRSSAFEGLVDDCSETGVRITVTGAVPADFSLGPGDRCGGTIQFSQGESVAVEGEVLRFQGKELVLRLDAATVPFRIILQEQRRLRVRYPWRK